MTATVKQAETAAARLYDAATRAYDTRRKADIETADAAARLADVDYSGGAWTAYNMANIVAKDAAALRFMAFEAAKAHENVAHSYALIMDSWDSRLYVTGAKADTDAARDAYIASETVAAQARVALRLFNRC